MKHVIDIQIACNNPPPVSESDLSAWISAVLDEHGSERELTLRLVNSDEISELNKTYRKKDGPTNVLAFPSSLPEHISLDHAFLGDIIVCPEVLATESVEQQIPLNAHWAHIIIHGTLHLLGYDHYEEPDITNMQTMETRLMTHFGFPNPWQQEDNHRE
ncbi:rRNA maturation RNase YbeY [Legionella sp. CNM-4043-24]|uniref:rRNA maturation RNase YbeY n=1 Tax=Legionella sp. CNM-4043-24 TaxID=3421646 RepID=UPI00403B03FC